MIDQIKELNNTVMLLSYSISQDDPEKGMKEMAIAAYFRKRMNEILASQESENSILQTRK